MENRTIFKTTISTALLKKALFKGVLLAFPGISALLIGGIFLSPPQLAKWGFFLFAFAIGSITLGMLPYRRLSRLQLKPNEIHLTNNSSLEYYVKGVKLLTIPLQAIEKIELIHPGSLYGLVFWLKKPSPAPVLIHQQPKKIEKMRLLGRSYSNADLFLPYFNQRTFKELRDCFQNGNYWTECQEK